MKSFWQLTQVEKKAAIAIAEQELAQLAQDGVLEIGNEGDYTTNSIKVLANMAAEGSWYTNEGFAIRNEVH